MVIRKIRADDEIPVTTLLDRAFAPSVSESKLVIALRERGKISLEMVIEHKAAIVGYIGYTRAYDTAGNLVGYHLAPLAVMPGMQRRGLGKRLIKASLAELNTDEPIYVLGDPEYYSRSGFRLDRTQQCTFDPEGRHFMVLFPGPLHRRNIGYENEFYELAGSP